MHPGQGPLVKVVHSPPKREGPPAKPYVVTLPKLWAGMSSVKHLTDPYNALGIVTAAIVALCEA